MYSNATMAVIFVQFALRAKISSKWHILKQKPHTVKVHVFHASVF